MKLEVFHTPHARSTLTAVYNYIENNFGGKEAEKFINKAEKTIDLIASQPYIFKASEIAENIRIGLINKQCSFFYKILENRIDLLFFWDNRQKPIL